MRWPSRRWPATRRHRRRSADTPVIALTRRGRPLTTRRSALTTQPRRVAGRTVPRPLARAGAPAAEAALTGRCPAPTARIAGAPTRVIPRPMHR
jgi:hypothetical protein